MNQTLNIDFAVSILTFSGVVCFGDFLRVGFYLHSRPLSLDDFLAL